MNLDKKFDAIIVGGSYSGLSAAMSLGRALKKVLIIDGGKPCNRQTPHSHNFLTQDGKTPTEISTISKQQVALYDTVQFFNGQALQGTKTENGFEIEVDSGDIFSANKLIFATGIIDDMPAIKGFSECWGISVLHCPYCHGYEVSNQKTGILADGENAYELAKLIVNWTKDLTIFTNGIASLTGEQKSKIEKHQIKIIENEIKSLNHQNGYIQNIVFKDGTTHDLKAIYSRNSFKQHSNIPALFECELTNEGYIKVDAFQETTVEGIYACGDNVTKLRTVANAVAMGTNAGMSASKKMIMQQF
ncbi:MAG: NAD(P)/FAD-dependent oxidoreductase [Bacteroidia bacterium]|nr:NAD(P)/FAD-dependent oxidoreductase [Bacteroidia bacterium]